MINSVFLFAAVPNILLLFLNYFVNRNNLPGSDHYYHASLIDAIKKNGNKFISKSSVILSEENMAYPQLFHWILSFCPETFYKKQYGLINLMIKFFEVIAFNFFLYYIYSKNPFDKIIFLYANIIVNLFPLSFASWNAKNMGLSARGFGLVFGQIYTYLIYIYTVNSGNLWFLIVLFLSIQIIILTSQMAMQYVILSLPFFAFFLHLPEILSLPFLAFAFFYVLNPKVAKKIVKGQYNHKRNYYLFLAEIFILKARPSIYRDFVYDFWIKRKDGLFKAIAYLYLNPIVEIIYGLPFLWFVIYEYFNEGIKDQSMMLIVFATLSVFFLISFRITRFLGEPQRYLEFAIPLITILYVTKYNAIYHLILIAFSLFIVFAEKIVLKSNTKLNKNNSGRERLLTHLKNNVSYQNKICTSNDHDFLNFLLPINVKIVKFDLTSYYKNKEEFNSYFYKNDYNILGYKAITEFTGAPYATNLMVINNKLYTFDELRKNAPVDKFVHSIDIDEYSVYELKA